MGTFFLYLIKSSVCIILFYLLYKSLLSKETFFRFNRKVLLGGIGICLLLPLISLKITHKTPFHKPFSAIENKIIASETEQAVETLPELPTYKLQNETLTHSSEESGTQQNFQLSAFEVIAFIYAAGCGITLLLLLISCISVILLMQKGRRIKYEKYTLIIINDKIYPFSIGRFIVISEDNYSLSFNNIFAHEQIHADKKHSLDMLFAEAVIILQWFNPAIWLLKRELQSIHEYEADNGVIQSGIDATQYQLLLIKEAAGVKSYAIASRFKRCKIKHRITMMLKKKSTQRARWKALLFVPLAAIGLLAFAQSSETVKDEVQVLNQKSPRITGTWKLVETNGKAPSYQSIKMLTDTHFSWNRYNEKGDIISGAGGKYTLSGETYTEFIETTAPNMKFLNGTKGVFTIKVADNKLFQTGILSDNIHINEVWEKVD